MLRRMFLMTIVFAVLIASSAVIFGGNGASGGRGSTWSSQGGGNWGGGNWSGGGEREYDDD